MKPEEVFKLFITFTVFLPYFLLLRPVVSWLEERHANGSVARRAITYIPLLIVGWPIEKAISLLVDQKLMD